MEVHIVQKGDTLWKISRQFGVSFDELKRVNAHLANPDYIVPGMKIFVPAKSTVKTETKPVQTTKVKKTEKAPTPVVKKQEKAPEQLIPVPETPAVPGIGEMVETPAPPIAPVQPVAPPMPPPIQEAPPMPVPPSQAPPVQQMQWMQQTVQMPQMQQMPMQQMPFFGVPCGWMPIFDADCYPYMYHGHSHHPVPMASPQLMPESPLYTSEMPMQLPVIPMAEDWKLDESPNLQFEEDIKFEKMPNVHFEESPGLQVEEESVCIGDEGQADNLMEEMERQAERQAEEQVEKEAERQVERAVEEEYENLAPIGMQQQYETAGGWDYMGHPTYGVPSYSDCGCGQMYPMNAPIYQHANYCNACNQPIHAMPVQMMPYPTQNYSWRGPY